MKGKKISKSVTFKKDRDLSRYFTSESNESISRYDYIGKSSNFLTNEYEKVDRFIQHPKHERGENWYYISTTDATFPVYVYPVEKPVMFESYFNKDAWIEFHHKWWKHHAYPPEIWIVSASNKQQARKRLASGVKSLPLIMTEQQLIDRQKHWIDASYSVKFRLHSEKDLGDAWRKLKIKQFTLLWKRYVALAKERRIPLKYQNQRAIEKHLLAHYGYSTKPLRPSDYNYWTGRKELF